MYMYTSEHVCYVCVYMCVCIDTETQRPQHRHPGRGRSWQHGVEQGWQQARLEGQVEVQRLRRRHDRGGRSRLPREVSLLLTVLCTCSTCTLACTYFYRRNSTLRTVQKYRDQSSSYTFMLHRVRVVRNLGLISSIRAIYWCMYIYAHVHVHVPLYINMTRAFQFVCLDGQRVGAIARCRPLSGAIALEISTVGE